MVTYSDLLNEFPTEKEAVDFFVHIRYGDKVLCPHCGSINVYNRKGKGKLYGCSLCRRAFSVFGDTLIQNSNSDVRKWLYALYLVHNGGEGISAEQLGREIDVTDKTARRMIQKIKQAMDDRKECTGRYGSMAAVSER